MMRVQFHTYAYGYPFSQTSFIETELCHTCLRSVGHICVGLFLDSILFHWSIYLFLCQDYAVLIILALSCILKSGNVTPPALLFLLKLALAIWSFGDTI